MTNFDYIKSKLTLDFFERYAGNHICELIRKEQGRCDCWEMVCDECKKWLHKEHKKSILDAKEREYLSAVITPFRNEVRNIEKIRCAKDLEQICIGIYENIYDRAIFLPSFDKGIMYKGMELNKEYTLEELGL